MQAYSSLLQFFIETDQRRKIPLTIGRSPGEATSLILETGDAILTLGQAAEAIPPRQGKFLVVLGASRPFIAADGRPSQDLGEEAAGSVHLLQWFQNLATAGFFLHRETLEILDPNAQAVALLGSGRGLATSSGRLVLAGKGASETLRAILESIDSSPAAHAIKIDGDGHAVMRLERVGQSDLVAVLILSPHRSEVIWADTRAVFGLTPAEDRLVKQLMEGANIEQVSNDLDISIETARTHVRRSYLKIGVTNREQLFAALSPFRLRA